jgi:hypothetical protein
MAALRLEFYHLQSVLPVNFRKQGKRPPAEPGSSNRVKAAGRIASLAAINVSSPVWLLCSACLSGQRFFIRV